MHFPGGTELSYITAGDPSNPADPALRRGHFLPERNANRHSFMMEFIKRT